MRFVCAIGVVRAVRRSADGGRGGGCGRAVLCIFRNGQGGLHLRCQCTAMRRRIDGQLKIETTKSSIEFTMLIIQTAIIPSLTAAARASLAADMEASAS